VCAWGVCVMCVCVCVWCVFVCGGVCVCVCVGGVCVCVCVFQVARAFGMVTHISPLNSLFSRLFLAISERTN